MHVKGQVKEFIHDVKRRFSKKHNRESTCSTCATDSYDENSSCSSDSLDDDATSYSASLLPVTPQRRRLVSFLHRRTPSSRSKESHRAGRVGSMRHRLSSAPPAPSMHVLGNNTSQSSHKPATPPTQPSILAPVRLQEHYLDVIDISAGSLDVGLTLIESTLRDSPSPPLCDAESRSETSATLVIPYSGDLSVSDSDSRINLFSDNISPSISSFPSLAPDIDVPPVPSAMPDHVLTTIPDVEVEEQTTSNPTPVEPSSPQASNTVIPALPINSSPASPAPVYIPRLTASSMFFPVPNTDPLGALLTKYVPLEQRPRRDITGEYAGRDIHEMVMSNSWRALAKMARDRIVASDPEDLVKILDLWSLRLSSLARLRLTNQASAECTNLFAVLNAVHPTSAPGSFPGSGTLASSIQRPSSPAPLASLSLSPSGLSGLAQLPGTPSKKPSMLPPTHAGGSTLSTTLQHTTTNELLDLFELTVFRARVHYWSGDPLGYVDALSRILAQCKERAREESRVVMQQRKLGKPSKPREEGVANEDRDEEDDILGTAQANLSMWLERIARVCLILAGQMIEMNDYQAAINLLTPLCTHRLAPTFLPTPSPELHSALARVYLLSGNVQKAEKHFAIAASAGKSSANSTEMIIMNTALLAAASGEWTQAEETLGDFVAKQPGNLTAINNFAVTLLCQGRIKEGIDLLEAALKTSPSAVVIAEPFLFNLSTLYELRSTAAIDKKRELLIKVALWGGDGLKTSCLKMPSS